MKKKTTKNKQVIEIHIYIHSNGVWTTPNYTPQIIFPNPNVTPTPNTNPIYYTTSSQPLAG